MHKTVIQSLFIISLLFCNTIYGQRRDSLLIERDTASFILKNTDTSLSDSIGSDTVLIHKKKKKKQAVDSPVKYKSEDSIKFNMKEKKVYLWGQAQINYQNIELKADYIIFDMSNDVVFASGWPDDTTGQIQGKPIFKQGDEVFNSEELIYNFKTKKGYITSIKSEQNGGYLHSEITKRNPNGEVNLRRGKYTTCDADHPHFYLALTKAKMIPNDKIVSGPAYIVIADVPLPIGLPFGFFPNTRGAKSGILIPAYGEDKKRGFKLQNAGYYFAINDYVDLTLLGDIYTRGSYGLNLGSNYRMRYKFSGRTSFRYTNDIIDESTLKNYQFMWSHTQDPKSNPYSTFSANVNMSSSSFDKLNSYDLNSRLSSTRTSSIMYTRRGVKAPVNVSLGLRQTQNNRTGDVTMDLPSLAFNTSTLYPLRRKNASGKMKWYENIQLMYNSSLENTVITNDSNMFKSNMFDSLNNGFRHSIPISTNFKVGNFFNITPSLTYTGMIYTNYIEKRYNTNTVDTLTNNYIQTINHEGLNYVHGVAPSIGFTLNPKIYGMYQIKNSKVKAIRHVISPLANFSYTPDMGTIMPNYYDKVIDSSTIDPITNKYKETIYSRFEKGRYGVPSAFGESGRVSLSVRNTLEMKVLSKNDTGVAVKKVPILENFDFSTSYNPFALPGTRKWSNINFNAGTRLFDGKYNIRVTGLFNPYNYIKTQRLAAPNAPKTMSSYFYTDAPTLWYENTIFPRLTNLTASVGTSFRSAQKKDPKKGSSSSTPTTPVNDPTQINPATGLPYNGYVDFNVPWTLNVNYDFSYSRPYDKETTIITQTIRFSGDLSLTKKWKFGFNTGYDIKNMKMSATNIRVVRDLHCWEMSFNCVPFGAYQFYLFSIHVKASMLQDLKYDKRQNWYDVLY